MATLNLDFQTDLHDLGGRNPEICGRKIGIEVHRGEQGLSPGRHAGSLAGDHHHPPEIVGDVLRIDAMKFGLRQASFSPSITSGVSMKPKWKITRVMPAPTGSSLMRLLRLHPWRVGGNHGYEQHTFVQDAIMSKMMCQAKRDALACGCEDRRRSGQTDGRILQYPGNELVLALAQLGALLLEQLPAGSPSQHEKRDSACQQKRKPAAFEQLGRVRRDENQIDEEEQSVDGQDDEQVVAPLQSRPGRRARS